MVYILEEKETNLKKYVTYINFFRKVYMTKIDKKDFCIIKIKANISDKKLRSIAKKIIKKLHKMKEHTIVMSKNIFDNDVLKNELKALTVLDGRWLFNYLIYDSVNYILNIKKIDIEKTEISILVNNLTNVNLQNILRLSDKVKNLNILTDKFQNFTQVKEKLLKEQGVTLRVTNNKRKALLKSVIIINLDFNEEEINKCSLPIEGIIINVNKKLQIKTKTFNGINISNYSITIPNEFKIDNFADEIVYESFLYSKTAYNNVIKRCEMDNIKINALVGTNGIIDEKEFKSCKLL
ncbi:MAG: hypothetical protein LBL91_04740 [Lachnospiraceae bacterium]|jgi:hypothetical protein|nr:hypothetical protein [Lachnospiraceae bacterium]